MHLTYRFAAALTFAERLHRAQTRKGNEIPYLAHLLAVAATVLERGGDEDTAIAAMLHDAVEGHGGLEAAGLIRDRFGERVASIVLACTDSVEVDPSNKPPWETRKQAYVAKLATVGEDVALVTAADKLHNLTAMIQDVRREGPATLKRFGAAPVRLLWYFDAVAAGLEKHAAVAPVAEIREGVRILRELVHAPSRPAEPTAGSCRVAETLPCPCHEPDGDAVLSKQADLGIDGTDGRFGDADLYRCDLCGRAWLFYAVEYEAFSRSGRWARGLIEPDKVHTITPETAIDHLNGLEWYLYGGSYFGGKISRRRGPISWDPN